jgi:hypothetical protein
MQTRASDSSLPDEPRNVNLKRPQCFCRLDASPVYSEQFGLLYECNRLHNHTREGRYGDVEWGSDTENKPENEVNLSTPRCSFQLLC